MLDRQWTPGSVALTAAAGVVAGLLFLVSISLPSAERADSSSGTWRETALAAAIVLVVIIGVGFLTRILM